MPGINMMPSGSTLQIPLEACTAFSASAGNAKVELTWTDPKDKYATPEGDISDTGDQLVSEWDHTVLVRKTGSQPAGPNDGTVVVSSSVRNQYQSTPYTDTGLTNDTTYYYAVFAYNKDGVASEGAFATATPIAGTPLSQLAEGTLIKILENGSPVEFYLAKHSYEPSLNGEGRELLVRKDIYGNHVWTNGNNNNWPVSSMIAYLNGEYKALFTSTVKELIGTTQYQSAIDGASNQVTTTSSSIFLPSMTELGFSSDDWSSFLAEGSVLPIYYTLQIAYYNSKPSEWWSRTPRHYYNDDNNRAILVLTDRTFVHRLTSNSWGTRPCFTLPNTAFVDADLNLIES